MTEDDRRSRAAVSGRSGTGAGPHEEVPVDAGSARRAAEDESQEATLLVQRAPHIDQRFDTHIERCTRALHRSHWLHYVASHSIGVQDFSVDSLDRLTSPTDHDRAAAEEQRRAFQRLGAPLDFRMRRIERDLRELHSGLLIRAVLQSDQGAVYWYPLFEPTALLGGVLSPDDPSQRQQPPPRREPARQADQAMSKIVTDLRRKLGLASQNPGAYQPLDERPWELPDEQEGTPDPTLSQHVNGASDHPVRELAERQLDLRGIHYLAYLRDNEQVVSVDILDAAALNLHHTHLSPLGRRRLYRALGRELVAEVGQLGRMTAPLLGRPLHRLVLDVERGALYLYGLGAGEFLFTVTLDQNAVGVADVVTGDLAALLKDQRPGA